MNPTDTLQPAPRKKQIRRTEAQWYALLDDFDEGELTVKQFCDDVRFLSHILKRGGPDLVK